MRILFVRKKSKKCFLITPNQLGDYKNNENTFTFYFQISSHNIYYVNQ